MIDFIIREDDKKVALNIKNIIDKFMMNYDVEYKCYHVSGYGEQFQKLMKKQDDFKIYFLDIKTNEGSGLDAARMIREEYDDWVSIIIIVTALNEFKYEALGNRLFLLDFINKLDNCDLRIEQALEKSMKHYDNRHKCLSFEHNHIIKKIDFSHIIYIEKEPDSKRCLIKTISGTQTISSTLNNVKKKLDKRFIKTHRSLIVNIDQIDEFNATENKITFKNGDESYLVARTSKKELIEKCQV